MDGIVEDLFDFGTDVASGVVSDTQRRGQQAVDQQTQAALEQLMRSGTFQTLLTEVENKARAGVVTEVKANAWSLFLLAIAGGAVGGLVLGAIGKKSIGLAALIAAGSIYSIYRTVNRPTIPVRR